MNEVRLIDANTLKDIEYINKGNFNTVEGIREWIDNAPTVNILQHKDWYLVNKAGAKELLDRERPQGDIRWTDKLSVKSNGDIIDFEGRVVGYLNLEEIKGGADK